jgi:hypothetical protein
MCAMFMAILGGGVRTDIEKRLGIRNPSAIEVKKYGKLSLT